jgi:hypothetical protein
MWPVMGEHLPSFRIVGESSSVKHYPVAAEVFERHKETCQTTSGLNVMPPFFSSFFIIFK